MIVQCLTSSRVMAARGSRFGKDRRGEVGGSESISDPQLRQQGSAVTLEEILGARFSLFLDAKV